MGVATPGEVWTLDLARVSEWMMGRTTCALPLASELLEGGRSNLTYRVTDAAGRAWILRRPPDGPSHGVAREGHLLAALHDARLATPRVVGVCEDVSVLGFTFFVMEFVDGTILRTAEDVPAGWTSMERLEVTAELVRGLVEVHATDPSRLGLPLRREVSYAVRQLRRWSSQWVEQSAREKPAIAALHTRLVSLEPAAAPESLVHGDFRLDNVVLSSQRKIVAILDWELATVGNPLADLGTTIAYWTTGHGPTIPPSPTDAGSFPNRHDVGRLYADLSGRDLTDLPYFVALAHWKVACIAEGVYGRLLNGDLPLDTIDIDLIERHADWHVARAEEVLADGI